MPPRRAQAGLSRPIPIGGSRALAADRAGGGYRVVVKAWRRTQIRLMDAAEAIGSQERDRRGHSSKMSCRRRRSPRSVKRLLFSSAMGTGLQDVDCYFLYDSYRRIETRPGRSELPARPVTAAVTSSSTKPIRGSQKSPGRLSAPPVRSERGGWSRLIRAQGPPRHGKRLTMPQLEISLRLIIVIIGHREDRRARKLRWLELSRAL